MDVREGRPVPETCSVGTAARNLLSARQPVSPFADPPPTAEVLSVSEVGGAFALTALQPEWNALLADSDDQVFYRSELLQAWVRHFAPSSPLRVLIARSRSGRLEAALPLLWGRTLSLGLPARILHAPSNIHTCRFDLVARDGAAAARALFAHLASDPSWDVLRLPNVPDGGQAWHLQRVALEAGFPVGTWQAHRSPYARLPSSVEALRQKWGKDLRASLRRRRRRLDERGQITVECFTGGPELEERLGECFAVEASGWKGRCGTAVLNQPRVRRFFWDVARAAQAHGYLCLYLLRLDGRPIAADFALRYRRRYLSFRAGYDERFATCSPGQLLTAASQEDCVRAGIEEFDLLGADLAWKRDWADQVRPHGWVFIFRDSRLGRALWRSKFQWLPSLKRWLTRGR